MHPLDEFQMAKIKSVRDIKTAGKRVLMRVDFNVPLDDSGHITDNTRITAALPTINYLLEQGAKVVLVSHLGRPKGVKNPKFSLKPAAAALAEKVGRPVTFIEDCIGPAVENAVKSMTAGSIILLENLRFHSGEQANDPGFSQALSRLGEIYVNDAFGTAHREHASTSGVTKYLPDRAAGLLLEKELEFFGGKLAKPQRPFVVILGGAKVSDKIGVIEALLEKADSILIGGAMAYTFMLARGAGVGDSLSEPDKITVAATALDKAAERGLGFLLPEDHLIVDQLDPGAGTVGEMKSVEGSIPDGWIGVDIGAVTIELYRTEIAGAKTIFWNGPMGIFEIPSCGKGTFQIAEAVAANSGAVSVIGGGDSVTALNRSGMADKVTFISTGGGAGLELLEGQVLPGVTSLETH